MLGPPGSGKTLLARSLPTVLPEMSRDEALEVTKIHSVSGLLPASSPLILDRPFRSPHYTISNAGLVGRRARAEAGRDNAESPGRAVLGRASRVRPHGAGGAEAADRGQGRHDQPGPGHRDVSGELHGGRTIATKLFGTLGRSSWTHSHWPLGMSSIPDSGPICDGPEGRTEPATASTTSPTLSRSIPNMRNIDKE